MSPTTSFPLELVVHYVEFGIISPIAGSRKNHAFGVSSPTHVAMQNPSKRGRGIFRGLSSLTRRVRNQINTDLSHATGHR